jgi:PAS domain S-box-containing protein
VICIRLQAYAGSRTNRIDLQVEEPIFQVAPDAVVVMDAGGAVRAWNPAATTMFGYRPEEAIGREVAELVIPGPLREAHRNALSRYLSSGEPTILGRRIALNAIRRDGSEFPVELSIREFGQDDHGRPLFAGFVHDISIRDAAQREKGRLEQRSAFLAQAWLALDGSPDYAATLTELADLTVPELAQLTVIDLREDDGTVRTAVAAAQNPDDAREVERMRQEHPLTTESGHPVAAVLRSGRSALLGVMSEDYQRGIAEGSEHFELMRRLRYHSAIVVPLIARQRVLGALSFLRLEGAEPYGADDLVLAEELARRAALTIDNARLHEATQRIAGTLQESLLPSSLPDIPGFEIAARYRAAARGQEVGGDFYDVFDAGENRWGIVIGDVCGKGPQAAARTARARYSIRAFSDRRPAEILVALNEMLTGEQDSLPHPFLTVVVAIASLEADGLTLELVAAGHPAPLLLRADGSTEVLPVRGPMIGVDPDAEYRPVQGALGSGDVMMLYTDGLTDAKAPSRVLTEADVLKLLARCHGLGADELATAIEAAATAGQEHRDDIAVLVVRCKPSDERPAGEERLERAGISTDA